MSKKPERKPDESLIEWLWRCEAIRRREIADDADAADAVQAAIQQHDMVAYAEIRAAWGRLGWEMRPKAKEADRIRAHALGVSL